ncbi:MULTISPECIES: ParB/RepB/Spo0J family partition protein [unclassified Paracoccus (in: a-proteobacteria)]|uniref:ParB/RepB/Spo0J family partition protein n=1 Tax=unclassified Paracoccus (in: a-proteobacteria) TaxID=2688777 RepID=UPI0012B1A040|nr:MULTISPECIES: ParB N-terminal domain-containing protein [unclassified Paracoccus (in: a-proteobacteria)]UXU74331.1 ParB N-terminal domain-containing protein [Paracoccus sp. SMMA_5]UXU80221.1 ParB N-terminal domain-containing protein [Paracoccus sp. SMMA_5_TC]
MAEPILIATKTALPPDGITAESRLRPVSEAGVQAILGSVAELGQIVTPLVVRQRRDKQGGGLVYELLDGAHRLEAARRLGLQSVPVRVFECTQDQARLLEIDGNLAGAELNALDTAVFLATRKAVYERLHPETRAGVAGALHKNCATEPSSVAAFATVTAEKFGMTERQVRKIVAAGSRLGPDEVARLRSAPRPVTLKDLQVIARIGNAAERYEVVALLSQGAARSAAEARQQWKIAQPGYEGPFPVDEATAAYNELTNRFSRAPMAAKRRFLEQCWPEMLRIMRDAAPLPGDEA